MKKKLLNQPFVVRFEKEEENLSDETVLTYQKGNSTCISFASLNSHLLQTVDQSSNSHRALTQPQLISVSLVNKTTDHTLNVFHQNMYLVVFTQQFTSTCAFA